MPRITVRRGSALAHVSSVAEAAQLTGLLEPSPVEKVDDGDFFEEIIEKRPVRRLVARLPRLNVLRRRGLCSTVLRRDFGLDLDTAAKTAEEARALEKTGPKEERRHFERVP